MKYGPSLSSTAAEHTSTVEVHIDLNNSLLVVEVRDNLVYNTMARSTSLLPWQPKADRSNVTKIKDNAERLQKYLRPGHF